jgi:hypothetical protein
MDYRLGWAVSLVVLVFLSCNGKPVNLETSNTSQEKRVESGEHDETYFLDLGSPSFEQQIDRQNDDERAKFVQVEVVSVTNPKKHPVSFKVYFQPKDSDRIYLGSFSLFPADNPGKFIVATQGKVVGRGKLVLEMSTTDKVDRADVLKVGIKKIRLRKQ